MEELNKFIASQDERGMWEISPSHEMFKGRKWTLEKDAIRAAERANALYKSLEESKKD